MVRTRLLTGALAGLAGALCLSMIVEAAAQSAVAEAAARGDREAVKTLLREAADVNAAQGDGMTALHWAAMHGDAEMARMLLFAGANTRAVTRLGSYTPLFLAARQGQPAVIPVLVEAGSDVNQTTATGTTPLMVAAQSGSVRPSRRCSTPAPTST